MRVKPTPRESREVDLSDRSSSDKPRIAVLGLGHVGLPTALGFAEMGWEVIGADDDAAKVAMIQSGQASFYEPGLGRSAGPRSGQWPVDAYSMRGGGRARSHDLVCLRWHSAER